MEKSYCYCATITSIHRVRSDLSGDMMDPPACLNIKGSLAA